MAGYDLLPDLCDLNEDKDLNLLEDCYRNYGGRLVFYGRVSTIRCAEDNSRVREAVAEDGKGRVLVVDGLGSTRRSLLGDMLAAKASANGWEGIVIHGAVRDVVELSKTDLGIKALAAVPMKTVKKGLGERDVAISIANISIQPGDYIYSDSNGILLSKVELQFPKKSGES